MKIKGTIRVQKRNNSNERILRSAIRCFGEKGYANCAVTTIGQGAGVTSALVLQRFISKENLLGECCKVALNEAFHSPEKKLTTGQTLKHVIQEIRNLQDNASEQFYFFKTLLNTLDLPENFMQYIENFFNSSRIHDILKEAQAKGELPAGDLYRLFQAFLIMIFNQLDISRRFDLPVPDDQIFLDIIHFTGK